MNFNNKLNHENHAMQEQYWPMRLTHPGGYRKWQTNRERQNLDPGAQIPASGPLHRY